MVESFEISEVIPATPRQIYEAWLSSKGHAEMTGGPADIDPSVGGKFSMFGGVIYGQTLEMEPHSRIVQSWRALDCRHCPTISVSLSREYVRD